MLHSRKNDLLIGFIVSALLSLFVNFSMLIRKYDVININKHSAFPAPPEFLNDYFFYFPLLWFFLFAFFLFIINIQMYKLGDKIFRQKEYKAALFAGGISVIVGLGLLIVYPTIQNAVFDVAGVPVIHETVIVESRSDKIVPGHGKPISRAGKSMDMRPDRDITLSRMIGFHPQMTEHLFVLLTVLLSVLLIRLISGKQQMMLEYEKLKTEKLQTSYNALMGQINPHFFFNSLNGLNALIRNGEKEQTLTYLDELSNVFRYILQSNKKEMVTLAEELQFVKAYTYLLGVRYEGKLFFSIQAAPALLLCYLPILSVLPLIENAVKHNVISKQYPLQIDVYTTEEHALVVSNKIHSKVEEEHSSGIGLKNLWGRYRLLTGKDIVISNRKEYFKVSLPLLDMPVKA
ncbi:sensor histidine kinase [Parabacteroides sp.]